MAVVAWDCASDEYREMAYGRMAEDIEQLRRRVKSLCECLESLADNGAVNEWGRTKVVAELKVAGW